MQTLPACLLTTLSDRAAGVATGASSSWSVRLQGRISFGSDYGQLLAASAPPEGCAAASRPRIPAPSAPSYGPAHASCGPLRALRYDYACRGARRRPRPDRPRPWGGRRRQCHRRRPRAPTLRRPRAIGGACPVPILSPRILLLYLCECPCARMACRVCPVVPGGSGAPIGCRRKPPDHRTHML